MKNRWHFLLMAVGMLCAATVRAETTTLEVAAYPALDKIIAAGLPGWNALHPDVQIRIVSRSLGDHHKAMSAAIAEGDDLPDVMAIETEHLRKFVKSGGLENLAKLPYKGLLYRRKFVDYTFPLAIGSRGEMVAMPTDIGPGTLFYRRDLLEKAKVSTDDLTRSWESFVEAGKKIKAATGAYLVSHASDIANIVIRSNLKDGESAYFDKDNRPAVDSARFIRAFELAKTVRDAKLDANAKYWSVEGNRAFQRGMIATSISGAWFGGYLAAMDAAKTTGLWRVANLPGDTFAYMGGTYYGILKRSKNKEVAWEFVKFMTLDKGNQLNAFKLQDAFPALLEAQIDPFFDQPLDFLGGQKARLIWRDAARRIPSIKPNEYDSFAYDIIEEELDKVLDAGKEIPTALKDARATIEEKIASEARQP